MDCINLYQMDPDFAERISDEANKFLLKKGSRSITIEDIYRIMADDFDRHGFDELARSYRNKAKGAAYFAPAGWMLNDTKEDVKSILKWHIFIEKEIKGDD